MRVRGAVSVLKITTTNTKRCSLTQQTCPRTISSVGMLTEVSGVASGVPWVPGTPFNSMDITVAVTDRSVRIIDRVTGGKIEQILMSHIVDVVAVKHKPAYFALVTKRPGFNINACHICTVATLNDAKAFSDNLLPLVREAKVAQSAERLHANNPFAAAPGAYVSLSG